MNTKKCPFCAEEIQGEAIKCKHCGSMLDENNNSTSKSTTKSETKKRKKKPKRVSTSVGCLIIIVFVVIIISFIGNLGEGPNQQTKPTATQSDQTSSNAVPTSLTEAQKEEKAEIILNQLKSIPVKEYEKNRDLYQQITSLYPDNEKYKTKFNFYQEKVLEKRKKERIAAERKKKIEDQFSSWDGSHRTLTRLIKASMNDPKSYDHVETVYGDMGDYLVIKTTYRGKNAFGGVVVNWVKAKVDMDGNVLAIIESYP